MAEAPHPKFSSSAILIFALPVALLLLVPVGILLRDRPGLEGLAVIGWTTAGVLALLVVLSGILNGWNGLRRGALIRANPGDFIAQLLISPPQATQINLLGARLTGRRRVVGENAYGTVVADETAITLYGGASWPREWLAIPTERLVSATVGDVLAGARMTGSLHLEFDTDRGSRAPLDLHLYVPARGFRLPRLVQGELLAEAVAEFLDATAGPAHDAGAGPR